MNKYEKLLEYTGEKSDSEELFKTLREKGKLLADLAGEKHITVFQFEKALFELERCIPYAKEIAKGRAQIQLTGKPESS